MPPLPGPCSLLQRDWLADRESADYRLSSPARVISGGVEQARSQACQGPSEEDLGGATELHHQPHRSPSALEAKWINLPSPLHFIKSHGEGRQGQGVRKVFSQDWRKVFFKTKAAHLLKCWRAYSFQEIASLFLLISDHVTDHPYTIGFLHWNPIVYCNKMLLYILNSTNLVNLYTNTEDKS